MVTLGRVVVFQIEAQTEQRAQHLLAIRVVLERGQRLLEARARRAACPRARSACAPRPPRRSGSFRPHRWLARRRPVRAPGVPRASRLRRSRSARRSGWRRCLRRAARDRRSGGPACRRVRDTIRASAEAESPRPAGPARSPCSVESTLRCSGLWRPACRAYLVRKAARLALAEPLTEPPTGRGCRRLVWVELARLAGEPPALAFCSCLPD